MKKKNGNRIALVQPAKFTDPDLVYNKGEKILGQNRDLLYDELVDSKVSAKFPYKKEGGKHKIFFRGVGKDERGRTIAGAYINTDKNKNYRDVYKKFLNDTRDIIAESGMEELSQESKKAIKDAIRKQAKKEAIVKGSAIGLGVAGLGTAGVVLYKHYKNKKSKK